MYYPPKNEKLHMKTINSVSKKLYVLLLVVFISTNVFAQHPDREKIKALKVAHITEQLDLTEAEAQKFWPIYNANKEAEHQLREESSKRRKEQSLDKLTENEAKALLLDMEKAEKQKVELHSKMLNNLLTVLPAKKIIKLYQAERSFRKKMLDEYRKRHANKKGERK